MASKVQAGKQKAEGGRRNGAHHSPLATRHSPSNLQLIVDLSGIRTQTRIPNRPIPSQVVQPEGLRYKVRAYPGSEIAQQWQEIASEASGLVAQCYGRVERYLVMEYVEGSHPADPMQALEDIAYFLCELEAASTKQSP